MFTCASAKQLRGLAEAIQDLVSEVNLDVSPTAISVQAIDTSHVCLISIQLDGNDTALFDMYTPPEEGALLGVNVANLIRALKCAGPDDKAVVTCTSPDTMQLTFVGDDDTRSAEFELKLMIISTDTFSIPDREHCIRFKMSSSVFARAIKDLAGLGDTLQMAVTYDEESAMQQLTMSCDGDIGRASITFKSPGDAVAECRAMKFSLKHMVSIAKASVLSNDVVIELVEDMPLCTHFVLSNAPTSVVKFFLAPKISDELEE